MATRKTLNGRRKPRIYPNNDSEVVRLDTNTIPTTAPTTEDSNDERKKRRRTIFGIIVVGFLVVAVATILAAVIMKMNPASETTTTTAMMGTAAAATAATTTSSSSSTAMTGTAATTATTTTMTSTTSTSTSISTASTSTSTMTSTTSTSTSISTASTSTSTMTSTTSTSTSISTASTSTSTMTSTTSTSTSISTTSTSTTSTSTTSTSTMTSTTSTSTTTTSTSTTTTASTVATTSACSTFLSQTNYSTGNGSRPYAVAVGDVNGDNKPDIVVANFFTSTVGVFFNTGNGTFLNQITYSTGAGSYPQSVAVVDVNSDNKLDIVTANYWGYNVAVLLNTGNGTFLNLITYSAGTGSHPYSVAVADVNNDNKPDIVVANYGTNTVGVFLNVGNGTFLNQTTYSTGVRPYSVAIGDVNSDNKSDIVVVYYSPASVAVLFNTGNGTFVNQNAYSTGSSSTPFSVVIDDVNSDNKPDIIVANYGSGNVGVFLNVGNGTFLNQTTYSTGAGSDPTSVAVGDVNSDNKPDIVAANNYLGTVSVFLNAGNGIFLNQTSYPLNYGATPYTVVLADVNGDNKPDIVVANYATDNIGVLFHC